jgi:hypothetical protein
VNRGEMVSRAGLRALEGAGGREIPDCRLTQAERDSCRRTAWWITRVRSRDEAMYIAGAIEHLLNQERGRRS